jgi:succinate dehydrogenase / fumarate reductase cytochrome b subunit
MTSLGNALASSVGKKIVMGLTGLLLVGFLVEHLHGNLKLVEDPSGQAFEEYVSFLQGFGPLLVVGEVGLGLLFLSHVYLALRLTLENLQARRQRYVVRSSRGGSSAGSVSMFWSGALILGFLVKHLLDFRFSGTFFGDPSGAVAAKLSQPGNAVVYTVIALVVGLHLSHGFRSALQSLGVNHPRWNTILERLGKGVAFVLAAGFAAIPIFYLFFWSEGGHQ